MRPIKKVLIVDTETGTRNILFSQLKEKGWHALAASDYADGLYLLRKIKDISLIVLNLQPLEESSLDFYDAVKKEFPRLKILISSEITKEEQKFLVYDADDYFCKSEDASLFVHQVGRLLQQC